jgi:hypothetical protein
MIEETIGKISRVSISTNSDFSSFYIDNAKFKFNNKGGNGMDVMFNKCTPECIIRQGVKVRVRHVKDHIIYYEILGGA